MLSGGFEAVVGEDIFYPALNRMPGSPCGSRDTASCNHMETSVSVISAANRSSTFIEGSRSSGALSAAGTPIYQHQRKNVPTVPQYHLG